MTSETVKRGRGRQKGESLGRLKSFACPVCGKGFAAYDSDVHSPTPTCSRHCSRLKQEADRGHGSVELPCQCGCGALIRRPQSRVVNGNPYVNRAHYLHARYGHPLPEETKPSN